MILLLIDDLFISLRLLSTHSCHTELLEIHLVISKDLKPALKYILFSSCFASNRMIGEGRRKDEERLSQKVMTKGMKKKKKKRVFRLELLEEEIRRLFLSPRK